MNDQKLVLINPKIINKSKEMFEVWDSCFCFKVQFFVKVKRYKKITVDYMNEFGKQKRIEAQGDLSELLQHEIDHLHGILCTDRMINKKQLIMRHEFEKIMLNASVE